MTLEKAGSIFKRIYPYILILVATLFSNYFVFFKGIMSGDDIRFHLFQITDLLYGFDHGYFGLSTNHVFMGGFAVNNYGFYGPVPHYAAAIIARVCGGDAEFGYKAVIVLSSYIGGIFFYQLALRMSKNVHIAAISAVMFILMPYRIFCAVCRCAFAEVVAICFIPLIFFGAYAIVHDDKFRIGPYLSLIFGASVVIMSHPFTGMMCAIFGALYLAFNVHLLIKKRAGFHIWPWMIGSAVLIVFLVGFYVANAFTTKGAGIYRLNDPILDWTNYAHVADSTSLSLQFSGFLNFIYISNMSETQMWQVENVSYILVTLFVFILSITNGILADSLIRLAPKNKYYRWAVNGLALFMFPLIFGTRLEIYLALLLFFIIFNFFSYFYKVDDYSETKRFDKIKYCPDLYFLIFSIFVCLLLVFVPKVWSYLPEIFYQTQFAWRLWGLTMFFIAMLIVLIASYLQVYKGAIISLATFTTLLLGLSQGLIEKRLYYSTGGQAFNNVDYAYVMSNYEAKYSGAQNEMVPMVLMDNEYKSKYDNSLYYKVRFALTHWYTEKNYFIYTIEDYKNYNPVYLEGSGEISITSFNTPNNSFDAKVTSETSLIQFPQIYNEGYVIYGNGEYLGEAQNVDGLIAFNVPKGEYKLDLVFNNSKGYQIARPFLYVGLGLLVPFTGFGLYYQSKTLKKKKQES